MFPRKCALAGVPHISFNNQTNYYLLSAIGNVLLEYIEPLGSEIAKNYKAALGNTFLYEYSSYRRSRFPFAKKNLLRNIKSMYNFTYQQKVQIIDLCTTGLNLISNVKQEENRIITQSNVIKYKSFTSINNELKFNDIKELSKIELSTKTNDQKIIKKEVLNFTLNRTEIEKLKAEKYEFEIENLRDVEKEIKEVKEKKEQEEKKRLAEKEEKELEEKRKEREKFDKEALKQAETIRNIRLLEKIW